MVGSMCERLRKYLEDSDDTQESLAEAMSTTQATISRWVSGRVPRDDIRDMSEVTGVPRIEYLEDVLGAAA